MEKKSNIMKNMGGIDRIVRAIVGIGLAYTGLFRSYRSAANYFLDSCRYFIGNSFSGSLSCIYAIPFLYQKR